MWSGTRNLLEEINVCQAWACVNQADGSRVLMCLSNHSPDGVVAHFVHLRAFVCLLVLFSVSSCARDMHWRSTSTQVRLLLISLSIHAVASLNKLVDVPVPQNSGTRYHWITSRTNCAIRRPLDPLGQDTRQGSAVWADKVARHYCSRFSAG